MGNYRENGGWLEFLFWEIFDFRYLKDISTDATRKKYSKKIYKESVFKKGGYKGISGPQSLIKYKYPGKQGIILEYF